MIQQYIFLDLPHNQHSNMMCCRSGSQMRGKAALILFLVVLVCHAFSAHCKFVHMRVIHRPNDYPSHTTYAMLISIFSDPFHLVQAAAIQMVYSTIYCPKSASRVYATTAKMTNASAVWRPPTVLVGSRRTSARRSARRWTSLHPLTASGSNQQRREMFREWAIKDWSRCLLVSVNGSNVVLLSPSTGWCKELSQEVQLFLD